MTQEQFNLLNLVIAMIALFFSICLPICLRLIHNYRTKIYFLFSENEKSELVFYNTTSEKQTFIKCMHFKMGKYETKFAIWRKSDNLSSSVEYSFSIDAKSNNEEFGIEPPKLLKQINKLIKMNHGKIRKIKMRVSNPGSGFFYKAKGTINKKTILEIISSNKNNANVNEMNKHVENNRSVASE